MHPVAFPFLSSSDLDHLAHGYPRPQLRRSHWISLNGQWDFSLDPAGTLALPEVIWDRGITVPFSPETIRSAVHDTSFYKACWYRRHVPVPQLENGERLLLHFGAVDYAATVWLDRALAGNHLGGYTPFTIDVTAFLDGRSACEIVVRAEDDPGDLAKPRGKQDWQLEPHSIWYPRTTGIWQTVWLERVPSTWIDSVRWTSSLERWDIGLEAQVAGRWREGLRLGVKLHLGDKLISDDTYGLTSPEIARRIALSDPGIDDSRNELLWSTASPTLISVTLQLWADRGELVDEATSYTAIRSVTTQGDRFLLNGRPFQLRLVLDQGYWEGSGITPPDDHALRRDVELTRAMGFNGVRKHQKVEDPRYLYWADQAGLLVWEEMPSAYRFTWRSVERLTQEWLQVIERDASHPCIVAWVPFNESWGAPNLPDNPAERHYIRSVYHLTKTLDPTRPVIGNDGWESVATDIIGIHDYDSDPARIGRRYHADEVRPQLFRRERPGGRLLVLEGQPHADHPIVLSEFGGIAFASGPGTWGYSRCGSADELAERYATLLETVRSLDLLAGFCYTQFADTYQEANGLLYADRRPKFSLAQIREATSGGSRPAEPPLTGPPDSGV